MLKHDRKSLLATGLAGLVFAAGASAQRPTAELANAPGWLAKELRTVAASKRAQMPPTVQVRKERDPGLQLGRPIGARRVGVPTGRYFVRLDPPSVVQHLSSLRRGSGLDLQTPLNVNGATAVTYEAQLRQQQAQTLQRMSSALGRTVAPRLSFTKALNGFSLEASAAEAERIAKLPGVARVQEVLAQPLDTDVGPALIGAGAIWNGTATGTATFGEGVTVGIIDSGINSNHPSFAATAGAFTHTNPLGAGTFLGYCATNAGFCNDKLIGAYDFVFNVVNGEPDVAEEISPEDNNSHGSHTASTVAGNPIEVDFSSATDLMISGVAPRANIIAYDACYTEISTQRGLCPQDATAASVEQAIDDGIVDVINFSIGGGEDPYDDFVSEAFLAATDAGIYIAASAGNDGPEEETLGHQEPWTSTTAATTHNREFAAGVSVTGPTTPPELQNIAYVQGTGDEVTVDILDDIATSSVVDPANATACAPFAAGAFAGRVALVLRGGCDFVVKVRNAQAAGAIAVIVRNQNPGAPIIQGGLDVPDITIPSVMIRRDPGQALSDYIAANPTATVRIDADETRRTNAQADVVADFSSRGPNSSIDVLKPDIAAPGVNILAAVADGFGTAGTEVGLISGTSMASPHNAGSAALLRALRPTWTPMEIKSALMLTAKNTGLVKEDEATPADPFDVGNGRVQVDAAARAGLVMNETTENFEDADPAAGGDPRSLNLASLYSSNCIATANCSFERTFTNRTGSAVTWNIAIDEPADVTMTATPSTFMVAAGASQTVLFEADASNRDPLDGFAFGTVTLSDDAGVLDDLHMNVAIQASAGVVPETVTINTRRDAGSQAVTGMITPPATDLTFIPSGLIRGTTVTGEIPEDSDNGDVFDDPTDGTFFQLVQPNAFGMRFVAEVLATEATDLDLFLGIDENGDGQPQLSEVRATSATATAFERAELRFLPPGFDYWILVQNWRGSANAPDAFTLSYAYVKYEDPQNLAVTAPQAPPAGEPYDIRIFFDEPAIAANERWYGALDVGGDLNGALVGEFGTIGVDLIRAEDDVVVAASVASAGVGDTVTYTVTVRPNVTPEALAYAIEDAVPAGMQVVANSVQATAGSVNVAGQDITWDLTMGLPGFDYLMTDSANDANCAMPLGFDDNTPDPYVNLVDLGVNPTMPASDGPFALDISSINQGVPFYQPTTKFPTLFYSGNGVLSFDVASILSGPVATGANVAIPNAALPNSLMALLWSDLSFLGGGAGSGRTAVPLTDGVSNVGLVVEFDNMTIGGNPANTIDAQVYLDTRILPNSPEIVFAYANPTGAFTSLSTGTIGLENADGSRGVQYAYNDAALQFPAATAVCFDLVQFGADETLTFDAVVQPSALGTTVVNTVLHDVDNPGSQQAAASASVAVIPADLAISKTDGVLEALAGETVTYTIVASNLSLVGGIGTVTDDFPAALEQCTWTCAGSAGNTCTAAGTGDINDAVTLAAGGSVTYTATCTVAAATGNVTLSNTAAVAAVDDPDTSNNSATDDDTVVRAQSDLSITVTDSTTTVSALGNTTYSIVVSNLGPADVAAATVTDNFPAPLTCTWTCAGVDGGSCTANGNGNIADTVSIPVAGSVVYTATCAINNAAGPNLVNTATVDYANDTNAANDTATDTNGVIQPGITVFRDGFED